MYPQKIKTYEISHSNLSSFHIKTFLTNLKTRRIINRSNIIREDEYFSAHYNTMHLVIGGGISPRAYYISNFRDCSDNCLNFTTYQIIRLAFSFCIRSIKLSSKLSQFGNNNYPTFDSCVSLNFSGDTRIKRNSKTIGNFPGEIPLLSGGLKCGCSTHPQSRTEFLFRACAKLKTRLCR